MAYPGLVIVKGGPADAPEVAVAPSETHGELVKIAYGGGVEHYEFSGEYGDFGEGPMAVYRWVYRKPGIE